MLEYSSLFHQSPCPDRIAPPTHICLLHLTHEQGLHRRLALARVQVPRQYRLDEAGRREPPNADSASRTTVRTYIRAFVHPALTLPACVCRIHDHDTEHVCAVGC
jgi:hypothetical protein